MRLHGADFFTLRDNKVSSVRGYFDTAGVPRQLGLDVIVQPREIGPFRFGISSVVQTGRTSGARRLLDHYVEARDEATVQEVRAGSRASLIDMLKMEGFIAATTSTVGRRMVTISAWESPGFQAGNEGGSACQRDGRPLRRDPRARRLHFGLDQASDKPGYDPVRGLRANDPRLEAWPSMSLRRDASRSTALLVGGV